MPSLSLPRATAAAGAAALAATASLALLVAPASAATDKGRDAAGDVRSRGVTSDTVPHRPEPARRVGDVVRHKTTYGAELVATTKLRSLAAVGDQEFSWFWLTSRHEFSWYASLVVQDGRDKGRVTIIDPDANQVRCGEIDLDRPRRTVTLRIPASCLGDPDWVKVAHGVRVYDNGREYSDDARRDDVRASGWKYGPRVPRG